MTATPSASDEASAEKELVDVRIVLQAMRPTLHEKSAAVVDIILQRPADVLEMTIYELAEAAGASVSLIIKMLKQIGVPGFGGLKLALARALGTETFLIQEDLTETDDSATVVQKVFSASVQALQDTMKMLPAQALDDAVRILAKAKRIEVYGIGSAAPIAIDAHYRLMRIGLSAVALVDSHLQVSSASLATKDTAILTISHSGRTIETLSATRTAKARGAKVVVITGQTQSPLREHADVVLQTYARETKFAKEAMTSRIAQLAIVDTLISALALARHDAAVESLETTYNALAEKRV